MMYIQNDNFKEEQNYEEKDIIFSSNVVGFICV